MGSQVYLTLVGRINKGQAYVFKLNDKKTVLKPADAFEVVRRTPSTQRNCMIRGEHIVLKPGMGNRAEYSVKIKDNKGAKPKEVRIVTQMESKNDKKNVYFVDAYFNGYVAGDAEFLKRNFEVLRKIDHIIKITGDFHNDIEIKTPYGLTNIFNLSSGCKCVLCALYLLENYKGQEVILNTDEAGTNAFREVCKIAAGTPLILYATVGRGVFDIKGLNVQVLVDGKRLNDMFELRDLICKGGV